MTEENETGVTEVVAEPVETDMNLAQSQSHHEEIQQPEQPKAESDAEINFRRLRESNERLQKENEQTREMLQAMQSQLMQREEPKESDPFDSIDPNDWTTFEQSKTLAERVAEQKARKIIEEYEAKRRHDEMPNRIRSRYADFDSVVTEANIKQLQSQEPELAMALGKISDEESKAVAAYKYIKTFVPQASEGTESRKRLQENAKTPKSLGAAGGSSPLSQAHAFEKGLTPELKKALFQEMTQAARRA